VRDRLTGYGSEPYDADLTKGWVEGELGADGAARYDDIPAGTCAFRFGAFYKDIAKYLEERSK